jgi:hypothetical protein
MFLNIFSGKLQIHAAATSAISAFERSEFAEIARTAYGGPIPLD